MNGAMRAGSQASGGVRIPRLLVAAGSRYSFVALDVRSLGPWSASSKLPIDEAERRIVYHHTASPGPDARSLKTQLARLEMLRNEGPWGLPYNFIVEPASPFRVWYLNDVDESWPHTYGGNQHVAIAAWGNFQEEYPHSGMVARMWRVADGLATMWGRYLPELQHRAFVATLCPGDNLTHALVR
jgi:hypothetical protein